MITRRALLAGVAACALAQTLPAQAAVIVAMGPSLYWHRCDKCGTIDHETVVIDPYGDTPRYAARGGSFWGPWFYCRRCDAAISAQHERYMARSHWPPLYDNFGNTLAFGADP